MKPGLKQTYELEKKNMLAIGKFSKRAAGLFNRKCFAKRVCRLLQGAMLFNMKARPEEIKVAVKVFQRTN